MTMPSRPTPQFSTAAKTRLLAVLLGLLPGLTDPCRADVLVHVATSGNDAWSGDLAVPNADRTDGPVATLERARNRVRELRQTNDDRRRDEPVRVVVANGRYEISTPLELTAEDGGSAAAPVSYAAAAGARPVISGGRRIAGFRQGSDDESGLWVADLDPARRQRFEQLFVNGRRATLAREPDTGTFAVVACDEAILGPDGEPLDPQPGADTAQPAEPQRCRQTVVVDPFAAELLTGLDPTELSATIMRVHHKWDVTRRFLDGFLAQRPAVVTSGRGMKPWNRWDAKSTLMFENARSFLDEPGEWFQDPSGRLLYKPRPGETLATIEAVVPVTDHLLVIRGDPAADRPCSHVTFAGLAFEHGSWLTPREGFEPAQAAASIEAAVQLDGAHHVTFRDCTIARVGTYGIWFRSGCRSCRVERCLIEDLGAGGVRIGAMSPAARPAAETAGTTIDNCVIRCGGRIFPCAVGVWIGFSPDNVVSHNEIYDFFYTGISVGWRWGYAESSCKRNRITDNHVHQIGQGLLSDMGGIYTLGPSEGTLVSGNVFHDIESSSYGGWGLYTDEGSTGITFEHNLVFRTTSGSFHQHYGRDNVVRCNVLVDARDQQVQATRVEDHRSFRFENNIVVWSRGTAIAGPWNKLQTLTTRNCWWNSSGTPVTFMDHSLEAWQAAGHEQGSIVADPLFVDPANDDYRLRPDSPAIPLGFEPHDWTAAGVSGDPAWKARARETERPTMAVPVRPTPAGSRR
jgi:hypothetical protein